MKLFLAILPGIVVFAIINKVFKIYYFGFKAIITTFIGCCMAGWVIMFLVLGGNSSDTDFKKDNSVSSTQEVGRTSESNISQSSTSNSSPSNSSSKSETDISINKSNLNSSNNNSMQSTTYNSFYNDRFQYSIEYPSYLTNKSGSANGDGVKLTDDSGRISLLLSGINNTNNATIKDKYNEQLENLKNDSGYAITYNALFDNTYAISWEDSNTVYYKYLRLGTGSYNAFTFSYPKSEENRYDPVIDHLYNTFKSSDLDKVY